MNYSDSERVASVLESQGLIEVPDIMDADIIVMTTCSIKQKAEDKVFSMINNIHKNRKKENRDVKIVITGCMVKKTSSQKSEEKDVLLKRIPEIDIVIRISEINKLPGLLNLSNEELDKDRSYFSIVPKYSSKFQALVPIQTGCDNYCTYCIVPYTRGHEWSRSFDEILKEIKGLAKMGVKEVTLVGQNVNSYGKEFKNMKKPEWDEENSKWKKSNNKIPFSILLEKVNQVEGIERIRFQSSNPHDMTDDIIEAITSLNKVMPSLHFALQSCNNRILKKMNRRHTFKDFKDIINKIRAKNLDFAITTDIIVGFCSETEEEFNDTFKGIQKLDLDLIYSSQYSERKGTVAAKIMEDDISLSVKKARWHKLNDWLKKHVKEKLESLVGTKQKILIENKGDTYMEGKTEHNRVCRINSVNYNIGDIVELTITGSSQWALDV